MMRNAAHFWGWHRIRFGTRNARVRLRSKVVLAVLAVVLPMAATAGAPAGATQRPPSVAPVFVPDVVGQFNALSLRPDGLGFDIGTSPDPEQCKHYQGIARVQADDGTPYLFVSRSGNEPDFPASAGCSDSDDPGNLLVVRMDSRDKTGERLRSNRLQRDRPIDETPPDRRDAVVQTITFDGTGAWPSYGHPGGMQLLGDVLAVALETPYEGDPANLVLFIDVSDPEAPTTLSQYSPSDPGSEFSAGLLGITAIRNADGSCCLYLMVIAGQKGRDLRFYRSKPSEGATTTDLTSAGLDWDEVGRFSEGEIEDCLDGEDWHTGVGDSHQMLNFVRQGDLDGPLFLVGGRNTTFLPSGDDMIDLYRVHLEADGTPQECVLTHVRSTHVTSDPYMGGGDSANFAGASGVYVSPSGELIVYAAELENDGPFRDNPDGSVGDVRTVRFGEYRHRNKVRSGSPTLHPTAAIGGPFAVDEGSQVTLSGTGAPPLTKAWIQLYEDDGAGSNFGGLLDSNQWLAVDYEDRSADDFDDFGELPPMDENAGSWRWFAPVGCTISANDYAVDTGGDPGPDTVLLAGSGTVQVETDLDEIGYDDDVGSVSFLADCDAYYNAPIGLAWDLDGDEAFETSGTSVPFSAALLDGPTTTTVSARAQHPTDPTPLGTGVPVPVPVQVRNVPPQVASATMSDSAGNVLGSEVSGALVGLPVTLKVSFTDPGYADTQTARVDWGDGTVDTSFDAFSDANSGAVGLLTHTHTYSTGGSYNVEVTITDDDQGATTTVLPVTILTPEQAIEAAADLLDELIAGTTDPAVLDALIAARDQLLGNHSGQPPTNGALDRLHADDPVGAITKLQAALENLVVAESAGAGDLSALKALVGLVAEAIATEAYHDAYTATLPHSPGEASTLKAIANLIASGHALLVAGDHVSACDAFRQATAKALKLSP